MLLFNFNASKIGWATTGNSCSLSTRNVPQEIVVIVFLELHGKTFLQKFMGLVSLSVSVCLYTLQLTRILFPLGSSLQLFHQMVIALHLFNVVEKPFFQ